MFYKLANDYILRGWEKMSWILIKRPENTMKQLSQKEFQTLLLCDGNTNISDELLDSEMFEILSECEKEGIIENYTEPRALNEDQYYKFYHNRGVRCVFWSITGRCNYRCRHCFMDAPDGTLGELSTAEALNLIDQMAECGVLRVDITGGEPFVRKDFWQLVDHILSYRMTIGMIYTNGWLLNNEVLDEFEHRNLKPQFSISFDGVGWHDWMRGINGAEKAALNALQICHNRNFPIDVEMCVHRGNLNTLNQTISILRSVGVDALKIGDVSPSELWCKHSEGNDLGLKEYIEAMIQYIPKFYEMGCPIELEPVLKPSK